MYHAVYPSVARYRDLGVTLVNIGVGIENRDKPEVIMPMIDSFFRVDLTVR